MREFTVIRNQRKLEEEDKSPSAATAFLQNISSASLSTKVLAGVVIFLAVGVVYLGSQRIDLGAVQGADTSAEQQAREVISSFSGVFDFSEEPSVAMVVNVESLRAEQPTFYADAQNGDALLVFAQKQMAFLYRPATGKIINAAPVDIPSAAPDRQPVPTEPTDFIETELQTQ